jgi:branched-chain amino acid transport system substrate-binding protein
MGEAAATVPVASAAVVSSAGVVTELNDGRGRRLLERSPDLVAHARALLASPLEAVRYVWIDPGGAGLSVAIERVGDEDAAELEAAVLDPPYGLTLRELDVLTLIAGGLSNPEIAAHLRASVRTITTHAQRILAKLDQSTRAGAAGLAIEQGLLRLPVPGGGRSIGALAVGIVDEALAGRPGAASRQPPLRARGRSRPRPYLIGSALPLSGPAAADGLEMRNGSMLAIAEINARGGIGGRPVEQLVVDTDIWSAEGVRAGLRRLVEAEVDAITTGYAMTPDLSRYADVAEYGCPLLNTMTLEQEAQDARAHEQLLRQVFQVGPTEIHYGQGCLRFLEDTLAAGAWTPRNRRLVFVETPAPATHLTQPVTLEAAERGGWAVDAVLGVTLFDTDWTTVLAQLHRSEPAAVVFFHPIATELAAFQRAFAAAPTETLVYAVYAPSTPRYLELAGEAAEGVVWSTVTGVYHDQIGVAFAQRYGSRFGAPPGRSQAGLSYDQVNLLVSAWGRVRNPRAFGDVGAELRRLTHRGVNGTYFLGHDRQCGLGYPDETPDPSLGQAHLVHQVQRGAHRILAPAPYADSTFRTPPWFESAQQA